MALSRGEPERAALLAGAVEGLRGRVGVKAWAMKRPGEDELVAQAREALGPQRMDDAFTAGSQLSLVQAVGLVRPDGDRSGVAEDS